MSESFDSEPTLDFKMRVDWSEVDEQIEQRRQNAFTFGSEGVGIREPARGFSGGNAGEASPLQRDDPQRVGARFGALEFGTLANPIHRHYQPHFEQQYQQYEAIYNTLTTMHSEAYGWDRIHSRYDERDWTDDNPNHIFPENTRRFYEHRESLELKMARLDMAKASSLLGFADQGSYTQRTNLTVRAEWEHAAARYGNEGDRVASFPIHRGLVISADKLNAMRQREIYFTQKNRYEELMGEWGSSFSYDAGYAYAFANPSREFDEMDGSLANRATLTEGVLISVPHPTRGRYVNAGELEIRPPLRQNYRLLGYNVLHDQDSRTTHHFLAEEIIGRKRNFANAYVPGRQAEMSSDFGEQRQAGGDEPMLQQAGGFEQSAWQMQAGRFHSFSQSQRQSILDTAREYTGTGIIPSLDLGGDFVGRAYLLTNRLASVMATADQTANNISAYNVTAETRQQAVLANKLLREQIVVRGSQPSEDFYSYGLYNAAKPLRSFVADTAKDFQTAQAVWRDFPVKASDAHEAYVRALIQNPLTRGQDEFEHRRIFPGEYNPRHYLYRFTEAVGYEDFSEEQAPPFAFKSHEIPVIASSAKQAFYRGSHTTDVSWGSQWKTALFRQQRGISRFVSGDPDWNQPGDEDPSASQPQMGSLNFNAGDDLPEEVIHRQQKAVAKRRTPSRKLPSSDEYAGLLEGVAEYKFAKAGGSAGRRETNDWEIDDNITDEELSQRIAAASAEKRKLSQAKAEQSRDLAAEAADIQETTNARKAKRAARKARENRENALENQADSLLAAASEGPLHSPEQSANRIAMIRSRWQVLQAAKTKHIPFVGMSKEEFRNEFGRYGMFEGDIIHEDLHGMLNESQLDFFRSRIPTGTKYLGSGAQAVAGLSPQGEVYRIGPAEPRLKHPLVLQALETHTPEGQHPWESYQLERLPQARMNATPEDVHRLLAMAQATGVRALDVNPKQMEHALGQVGFGPSGQLQFIDPGFLKFQAPHPMEMNAAWAYQARGARSQLALSPESGRLSKRNQIFEGEELSPLGAKDEIIEGEVLRHTASTWVDPNIDPETINFQNPAQARRRRVATTPRRPRSRVRDGGSNAIVRRRADVIEGEELPPPVTDYDEIYEGEFVERTSSGGGVPPPRGRGRRGGENGSRGSAGGPGITFSGGNTGGGGYNYPLLGGGMGGGGGGLPPNMINIPPGGGGGGGGARGFGDFYMRFLALEGVRLAADIGDQFREYQINKSMAMGDPYKLAKAEVGLWHGVASSVPFGIGKLGLLIRDPLGTEEMSVTKPLAEAEMQDSWTAGTMSRAEERRQLGARADIANVYGFERQRRETGENYDREIVAAKERNRRAAAEDTEKINKMTGEVTNSWSYWWQEKWKYRDPRGVKLMERLAPAMAEQSRLRDARDALYKSDVANAERERQGNLVDIQFRTDVAGREVDLGTMQIEATGAHARGIAADLPYYAMNRLDLASRQGIEIQAVKDRIEIAKHQDKDNLPKLRAQMTALKVAQTSERMALEKQILQHETAAELDTEADEGSGVLARQGFPFAAQMMRLVGKYQAKIVGADAADRPRITRERDAIMHEAIYDHARNESITNDYIAGRTAGIESRIARNPLRSRLADIAAERDKAMTEIPIEQGEKRDKTWQYYERQRDLAQQEYRDTHFLQRKGLEIQERVTGELAQAYGPGGRMHRVSAEVEEVVGQANQRARSRLLEDSTVSNIKDAETERRIGVNQLGAIKAQYLEGLHAQEGSLNRINLGMSGNGNPSEVLGRIAKGIQDLRGDLANLVAQD